MIVQYAVIPLAPDSREAAVAALTDLAAASRDEEGVIDYRVTTDIDDEHTVRIVELYQDEATVEAHMTSDHYRAFQGQIPDFVGGNVELYKYTVSDSERLL